MATPQIPPSSVYEPWPAPLSAEELAAVIYPESDGKPMAETDVHARCIIDARVALENFFAGDPNVYISGNLLLYYEEGDPHQSVAPDLFVVRGLEKRRRRIYQVWREGQSPHFVLEVTSRSTRLEDLISKRGLYQFLGVHEYVLFDPLGEYLSPALQAFRLVDGIFQPAQASPLGSIQSEVLGLELWPEGERLRFRDPTTNLPLMTPAEEAVARCQAERAAQAAHEAARIAEEAQAAAEEAQAAAEQRAREEAAARRRLEEELARLRAELERR